MVENSIIRINGQLYHVYQIVDGKARIIDKDNGLKIISLDTMFELVKDQQQIDSFGKERDSKLSESLFIDIKSFLNID